MKKIWVVSMKTSLPDVAGSFEDLKTTVRAFDTFEAARDHTRAILKKLAFGKDNAMFRGKGTLKSMAVYTNNWDPITFDDDGETVRPEDVVKLIRCICSGKDVALSEYEEGYDDGSIEISFSFDELTVKGFDGGFISTDMLAMYIEKPYHFYIDDHFESDVSAELYLDLIPTELEEA